jgi:hypothetical protein
MSNKGEGTEEPHRRRFSAKAFKGGMSWLVGCVDPKSFDHHALVLSKLVLPNNTNTRPLHTHPAPTRTPNSVLRGGARCAGAVRCGADGICWPSPSHLPHPATFSLLFLFHPTHARPTLHTTATHASPPPASAPDAASTAHPAQSTSRTVAPSYPLFPQLGSSSSSSSSYRSSSTGAMNPETCTKCRSLDIITGSFSYAPPILPLVFDQKPLSAPSSFPPTPHQGQPDSTTNPPRRGNENDGAPSSWTT